MAKLARLIAPLTHEEHAIERQAGTLGRLARRLQERLLRDERLGARVRELAGELVGGVGRVGGAGDAAGPVGAEVYDGGVDVVGAEEGEGVALGPAEGVLEALAEGLGEVLEVGKGVGAACLAGDEESWEGRKVWLVSRTHAHGKEGS
jgi:hypothetical protein